MNTYFKGLDSLRAIAAMVVVVGHIELLKSQNGIANIAEIVPDGHLGVMLFFVLSGFLITYLLSTERNEFGKVNLKNFYIRRILRIWPLYYFVLIISWLFFSADYQMEHFVYAFSIFPNVGHAIGFSWPTSPQIWSIGAEEQFYLFWPILLLTIGKRWVSLSLILFFIGFSILPHIADFFNSRSIGYENVWTTLQKFLYDSKFSSIALGCLMGHVYAEKNWLLNVLRQKVVAYVAIYGSMLMWMMHVEFSYFTDEIYVVLFAIAILNISTINDLVIPKENLILRFLGKISYGIYMYHWIVILIALEVINRNSFFSDVSYNLVMYGFVISCTILISWMSSVTLESYFLKKKSKFRKNSISLDN